jgi:glycosyltransferase involved in cell wall biosynthesis
MTLKLHPKISIITPVYNQVDYIEEAIKSVLNQNYPNIEYIIVDGGSTDGTSDIIRKYESQIFKWISEPDKGMYDALNKGFDMSTGEIMAWLNSDDIYFNDTFSKISEIFVLFPEVKWLQGLPTCIDERGRVVSVSDLKVWSKYDYYLKNYGWIQQESVFWRRELWNKSGGQLSLNYKYAGDLELWTRFFRYENLYSARFPLSAFRYRSSNQLSSNHLYDYYSEANIIIDTEIRDKIQGKEKRIIKRLNSYKKKTNNKLKIVRKAYEYLLRKELRKLLAERLIITFNRDSKKFEIK